MKQLGIIIAGLLLIPGALAAMTEDSVWPISNSTTPDEINDGVGPRISPGVIYDFHRGIDILSPKGTPIAAVMAGTVVRIETEEENLGTGRERFGNWIFINHTHWPGLPQESRMTSYFHMDDFAPGLQEGDTVEKGQVIGFVGNSGVGINTNHVHLELHKNVPQNFYSKDRTRNVMKILPYTDQDISTVTIDEPSAGMYSIKVSLPSDNSELDFNRIEIVGSSGSRNVDYDTREGIDPNNNDNNDYNGVVIWPDNYTRSHAFWNVTYNTTSSEIGTLQYVNAYDTHGNLLANVTHNGSSGGGPVTVFSDSFNSLSQWTESGEPDWRASKPDEGQIPGFPNGNKVAEADNCDTECTLTMTNAVDLSSYSSATADFWRLVDNDIDTGEYLEIEAFDGSSWNQIFFWTQGAGDDGNWHEESWNIPSSYLVSDFKMRFNTVSSTTAEEVGVDELVIVAE